MFEGHTQEDPYLAAAAPPESLTEVKEEEMTTSQIEKEVTKFEAACEEAKVKREPATAARTDTETDIRSPAPKMPRKGAEAGGA